MSDPIHEGYIVRIMTWPHFCVGFVDAVEGDTAVVGISQSEVTGEEGTQVRVAVSDLLIY